MPYPRRYCMLLTGTPQALMVLILSMICAVELSRSHDLQTHTRTGPPAVGVASGLVLYVRRWSDTVSVLWTTCQMCWDNM
jgi:hypothetical protein